MVGNWCDWLRLRPSDPYGRRQPLVLINGLAEQAESWFRNLPFWRRYFDVHTAQPARLRRRRPAPAHRRRPADQRRVPRRATAPLSRVTSCRRRLITSWPPASAARSPSSTPPAIPSQVARLVLLCPSGMGDEERLPIIEGVRRSDLRTLVESVFYDPARSDRGHGGLLRTAVRQPPLARWDCCAPSAAPWTTPSANGWPKCASRPCSSAAGEDRIVDPRGGRGGGPAAAATGHYLCLPQCGHAPQMEKPWLINRLVVHFLNGARPAARPLRQHPGNHRGLTAAARRQGGPTMPVLEHLAGRPLIRRLTDAFLGRYARRRVRQLDRQAAGPVQERTLLRLVRRARRTRFGRDHDFGRIRSIGRLPAPACRCANTNNSGRNTGSPPSRSSHDVTWPGPSRTSPCPRAPRAARPSTSPFRGQCWSPTGGRR